MPLENKNAQGKKKKSKITKIIEDVVNTVGFARLLTRTVLAANRFIVRCHVASHADVLRGSSRVCVGVGGYVAICLVAAQGGKKYSNSDCSFSKQVVFEGVRGTSYQGDIAIDDIVMKNGVCPLKKACSFEAVKMCGWTNDKR